MELMKSGISRFRELDGESAVIRALWGLEGSELVGIVALI